MFYLSTENMSDQQMKKQLKTTIETVETIPDLKIIRPKVFPDERGFFSETYNIVEWKELLDFDQLFKQDNHSYSKYGVVRGLHAQPEMGKLVSVITGEIYDVAVDIRSNSPTYGKHYGIRLSADEKTHFWIPPGFLHGFQTLSPNGAHLTYKCSAVYDPKTEFGVNPFDEHIGIDWPIVDRNVLIVSDRDKANLNLADVNNPF